MPNIPYPDVPNYPGVPALVRSANVPPQIQLALGEIQTILAAAAQSPFQWGIFDSEGNQLGAVGGGSNSLFQAIINSAASSALNFLGLAGGSGSRTVLSTNAFEFTKETRISDFPIEQGSFATFNKVLLPASPVVTLVLGGSANDRTAFLAQIDSACESLELFSIVTPEFTYFNYSIERYNLIRRAERGATLLAVELVLKEIRQVSAAYSTIQTPINQPQNPAATPQSNSGLVQPQAPPQSVLKAMANALGVN
jgi:hypothetical protein